MDFGWREAVLVAVAAVGLYLAIAVLALARSYGWRMPALKRKAAVEAEPARDAAAVEFVFPLEMRGEPETVSALTQLEVALAGDRPPAPFAATLAVTELESEVRCLRDEVAELRQELAELRDMRRVSPLYADAAALAQRGFDARGVAEECGISVAEAELVMAMSRDEKDFDSEVDDGDGRVLDIAR